MTTEHAEHGVGAPVFLIEVWADIACPWCYIGERRLQSAIAQVAGEHPEVGIVRAWRPFQLQPGMSPNGMPWKEFVPRKFGGEEHAAEMFEHVTEVGAGEGLDFRFEAVATAPNTRDAHRLVLWADQSGRGWSMAEALFRAYFTEGRDLNDQAQLAAIAAGAGLEENAARAFLATSELGDAVDASQRDAARSGITGVPFFVLDDRFAFSGAQAAAVMAGAIRNALRARDPSATR